jgi:hypothetical protein
MVGTSEFTARVGATGAGEVGAGGLRRGFSGSGGVSPSSKGSKRSSKSGLSWSIGLQSSKRGACPGIVARMLCIALVRVAEPWSFWNVIGALFLVAVVGMIVYWAIRYR